MKKTMIYLLAGLAALLFQTTVFSHLPFKADIVLILVVCLGLSEGPFSGAILAFLLGCLMDVFAGSTPGFFALTKTLVFLFVFSVRGHLFFNFYPAKAVLVLIAAFIEATVFLILARFTSYSAMGHSSMARMILGPIILTTLVAPCCFILFKRTKILAG